MAGNFPAQSPNLDFILKMNKEADEEEKRKLDDEAAERRRKEEAERERQARKSIQGKLGSIFVQKLTPTENKVLDKDQAAGKLPETLGNEPKVPDDGNMKLTDTGKVEAWLKNRALAGRGTVIPGGIKRLRGGSSTTVTRDALFDPRLLPEAARMNDRQKTLAEQSEAAKIAANDKRRGAYSGYEQELKERRSSEEVRKGELENDTEELKNAMNRSRKAIEEYKVKPNKYWDDLGMGGTLAMAIAAGASAFAHGFSGGRVKDNVLGMIQSGINNSIRSQETELKKRLQAAKLTQSEYKDAMNEWHKSTQQIDYLAKAALQTQIGKIGLDTADANLRDATSKTVFALDRDLLDKKNKARKMHTRSSTSTFRDVVVKPTVVGGSKGKGLKPRDKFEFNKGIATLEEGIKLQKGLNKFKPNFVSGPLGGPDTAKYEALKANYLAARLKNFSGAAVTEGEYKRHDKMVDGTVGPLQRSRRLGNYKMNNLNNIEADKIAQQVMTYPELMAQVPEPLRPYIKRAISRKLTPAKQ